jgi:putative chitinase
MEISIEDLRRVAGRQAKAVILQAIVDRAPVLLPRYGITTPIRARHFFAQIAHECDSFKTTKEYWGPTKAQLGYEGRTDLGNTRKGDGKRFMGRGLIQLTGRANYQTFGDRLGINLEDNPEKAADPGLSFEIACEDWKAKKLNALADRDDIVAITKKINGGKNGLKDRKVWLGKFAKLFPDEEEEPARVAHLVVPEDSDDLPDVLAGGEDPPPLNVQPVTATFNVDVKAIQQALIRIGYHEVGGVDGMWGGMTAAGIAAFKNDRGLKGSPVIDAELKAEISKCFDENGKVVWSRPIAPERANVTAAQVAVDTPAAKQTLWQWVVAKWTAVVAFVGSLFSGVSDRFETISDYVSPVRDFMTDIPGWLWLLGIGGTAALVWLSSRRATEAIVDDKRTGKLS